MKNNQSTSGSFFYDSGSFLKLTWPQRESKDLQKMVNQNDVATAIAEAVKKERKLIGQELHDNVNQILSSVKLFLGVLRPVDTQDAEIQRKSIEYVMMAIEEIRKISGELVVPIGKEKGLTDAIRTILNDIHFSTPIKIKFRYRGDIENLDRDKKTTLLRIVQEQLKNVIKYSGATQVTIDMHLRPDNVKLSVKDNGIGFDPMEANDGIGLINIYDRVQSHCGFVSLKTAKSKGCVLSVTLPLS